MNVHALLVEWKTAANLENSLAVFLKLNILLPYDSAVTPGIYANELQLISTKKPTHKCL